MLTIADKLTIMTTLQMIALIFARCLGTTFFVPIFARMEISKWVRVIFAVLLTFLVAPTLLADREALVELKNVEHWALFTPLILREMLWGALIGLTLKIFFEGVYLAGETIAKLGGISVAESFDSNIGAEISSVSKLLFWTAFAVFITMHGCELFLDGFLRSFIEVAPGEPTSPSEFVKKTVEVLGCSFTLAFKIAAPVCLSTLTVYITLGVLEKIFPQMNLLAIGFGCNALLTIVIMILGIGVFCVCFQDELAIFWERCFGFNN